MNTSPTAQPTSAVKAANDQELKDVISSLGTLPASPGVVNLVMGMTNDYNTDIHKLSNAMAADQSLTAKVLRVSNSPFYGRSQGVSNLEEAIVILGFYTLRSLVVATATKELFNSDDSNGPEQKLWRHSLATAMAARMVAESVGHRKIEEAFLAGLLHDIGKMIFLQKMPEEYRAILEQGFTHSRELIDKETEYFGFAHPNLGAALCTSWSFPSELSEAVRDHHEPDLSGDGPASISCIVALADALAMNVVEALGESAPEDLAAMPAAERLGMTAEKIADIQKRLPELFAEEAQRFSS